MQHEICNDSASILAQALEEMKIEQGRKVFHSNCKPCRAWTPNRDLTEETAQAPEEWIQGKASRSGRPKSSQDRTDRIHRYHR